MRYVVRAWTPRDAETDREISRALYPEYREEPGHPGWFPAQQLGAPVEWASRYVAEEANGERLAYATLWELRPHRFRFDLAVRPEWQGQGIGSRLLEQLRTDAGGFGATGMQARVRDDKPEALAWLLRRGFRESHRMGAYRLDFGGTDMADFEGAFSRLRDRGIEVTPLAAVRERDSDYVERFHELYSAARQGWPDPDPAGPTPVSRETLQRWLDAAELPEAFWIAKHEERHIAFTSIFAIGTAVHPGYRRRGIATMLKAGSIADAKRRGFRGQTTGTASRGMQTVLERLGYRRLWSEIRLLLAIG